MSPPNRRWARWAAPAVGQTGSVRSGLAVVTGAAVAVLGALILGEYPFDGPIVVAGAAVFGLLLSEAFLAVGRRPGPWSALACALLTGAGLTWAAWISTGHDLGLLEPAGWVAVGVGAAAAAVRAGWRRGAGTRPATSRTE